MGLGFSKNLLISDNLKIDLSEAEDKESESESSKNLVSSFFLEIARAVLVEAVYSVFIFCKSRSICSTFSIVLVWVLLRLKFCLWLGKSIKGFSVFEEVGFSIFSSIRLSCWPIICKELLTKLFCSMIFLF